MDPTTTVVAVVPATPGWVATFEDGQQLPILFWVINGDSVGYGMIASGNAVVPADDYEGFVEYGQLPS